MTSEDIEFIQKQLPNPETWKSENRYDECRITLLDRKNNFFSTAKNSERTEVKLKRHECLFLLQKDIRGFYTWLWPMSQILKIYGYIKPEKFTPKLKIEQREVW